MFYNQNNCIYSDNNNENGDNYYNKSGYTRAAAYIIGGPLSHNIRGTVIFKDAANGTDVSVEVFGLPPYKPGEGENPPIGPFGFHLHENGTCEIINEDNPFSEAGGHWNPTNTTHGNHAGDFPVLFSNDGYARMSFYTNKFFVKDIIGKAVIIHQNPDDYRSQPSGASGKRLACGVIQGIM